MRTRVWIAAAAVVVALGTACGPPPTSGPPSTAGPGLPVAPRLQLPASLGPDAKAVVLHRAPGGSAYTPMLVDASSDRSLNLLGSTDRKLHAQATGRVNPNTGAALMEPDDGTLVTPGPHPYRLCDSWDPTDNCRDVPTWGYVRRATFSPDGTKFATVDWNEEQTAEELRIFDVDDLTVVAQAPNSNFGSALTIAWSPDSSAVALTVPPDADGALPYQAAVATLAATSGSTPQIVVPSTTGIATFGVAGWSSAGRLIYRTAQVPGPDDPPPTSPPAVVLTSVPVDGPAAVRALAEVWVNSVDVVLPDGAVLTSGALPGGTPDAPHGVVVHHVTDAPVPVVTQLAAPQSAVVGGSTAWSTTLVLGIVHGA